MAYHRHAFSELINAILLVFVVVPPAWAVASASLDPTLPFSMLVWIALIAIIVGIGLAYTGLPGEIVHPVAVIGGLAGVAYSIAAIMPGVPVEASTSERLTVLGSQVVSWFRVVSTGGQATNNLLFLVLLSIVAWILGYFGGWSVFRARSAWWPVTASATALTLVLANFPNLYPDMLVELVGSMLLIGRMNLEARQVVWQSTGLRQSMGVTERAFRSSVALAIALVLLAWVAPSALASRAISQNIGQVSRPWDSAQAEFNRLFGGLQPQHDQASLSGFSRSLTLHGSFHLANTPVLRITSPRAEYWRAIVYDQYTNHGWLSSDPIDQRSLSAGANIGPPTDQQRAAIAQQVTVLVPRGNYLVGASQPMSFSRPVNAQAFPDTAGSAVDLVDVSSVQPVEKGMQYTVTSDVSIATAAELRTANQAYSPDIRQRYLSLPPIPERVHQLALSLTAGQPDPYDKAVAIESYLRTFPYTLDVPTPPANQDGVDYFLFTEKKGYCDYFASAMAVMLRSVGIPARVVSGYATGSPQGNGTYLVRDADSHSWTEAYFPPFGWIPFEPSGSWPTFQRGNGNASAGPPTVVPTSVPQSGSTSQQNQATPTPTPSPTPQSQAPLPATLASSRPDINLRWLLPWLLILALIAAVVLAVWYVWEGSLRGLPPAVVAYAKMTRLAALAGFGRQPSETPGEYGRALGRVVPEVSSSIERIASEYSQHRFGQQTTAPRVPPTRLWRFVRNALLRHIGRLRRPD